MVDDRDAVAEIFRFFQIMGGQHDGHAGLVEFQHIFPKLLPEIDIDAGGRLVQHQNRRRMDHCLRHQQPPLHPAGQGPGIGIGLVLQMDGTQQFHRPPLGLGHAIEASLHFQRLKRREKWVENNLLRHDPDRGLGIARAVVDIETPDAGAAAGLAHHAGQYVDQRRLAGAIGSEKPEDRAAWHVKADIIQRQLAAGVGFREILDRDCCICHALRINILQDTIKAFAALDLINPNGPLTLSLDKDFSCLR